MVAWAAIVLEARSLDRAPPLAAALLMVLWVNLHGSFPAGPAFAAAAAVEAWLQSPGRRARVARDWGAFLLLSLLACCATPQGPAGLLLPFTLPGMPALERIREWRQVDIAGWPPVVVLLLGLVYFGLTYGPRLPRLRVALAVVLAYEAMAHGRNQILFAVFGLLTLAEPLGRYFRATAPPQPTARAPRLAWPLWVLAAIALTAARFAVPVTITDSPARPVSALAHLPPGLAAQPVLNSYNYGGYLIFRGIHPYIDGRAELYGNAFLQHYFAMVRPSHALLAQTLAHEHIAWTLFAAGSPVADMMDLMPGWSRFYADKIAVIHIRDQR